MKRVKIIYYSAMYGHLINRLEKKAMRTLLSLGLDGEKSITHTE
jgi:hypothetical protein